MMWRGKAEKIRSGVDVDVSYHPVESHSEAEREAGFGMRERGTQGQKKKMKMERH